MTADIYRFNMNRLMFPIYFILVVGLSLFNWIDKGPVIGVIVFGALSIGVVLTEIILREVEVYYGWSDVE